MKFPKSIPPTPQELEAVEMLRAAVSALPSTLRLQIDEFEGGLSVHKQDHPLVYTKIADIPCHTF